MNKYRDIQERLDAVVEANRENKDNKTKEELNQDFFDVATDLFNEHLAGDITLADGRTINIPEI